ncbi:MAG: class I SAM-dependent methyltransferase [Smithella sp.]
MEFARYDEIARSINAPIYEYYAQKIKDDTAIIKGVCLDAGSGGGYLGFALAGITELNFIFLDISQEALELAEAHIAEDGLQHRAKTLLADVHSIPMADESVNLVISRGSMPFWKDHATAFWEAYRVLAPGGMAYMGTGRGSPKIYADIKEKMSRLGMKWPERRWNSDIRGEDKVRDPFHKDYDAILKRTGIPAYNVAKGDDGMWIRLWR